MLLITDLDPNKPYASCQSRERRLRRAAGISEPEGRDVALIPVALFFIWTFTNYTQKLPVPPRTMGPNLAARFPASADEDCCPEDR